jgi:TrmH family RNA methyltransferase
MLTTSSKKRLRKLQQKKFRWQWQQFIAEGPKVVQDLLEAGLKADALFALNQNLFSQAQVVSQQDLSEFSQLATAHEVLAIFNFPQREPNFKNSFLVLDGINDPGNLGTLIRTADWFGIEQIFCLPGTTDVYNAKTVQSTMGSLGRVAVHYRTASELYEQCQASHLWLKADMAGASLQQFEKPQQPVALVLGSESHGPTEFWNEKAQAITITKTGDSAIDSLNVAVAGAIFMQRLFG